MQGALDDFAAEEPSEDAHAGEKDAKAHIVELDDIGKNDGVALDLTGAAGGAVGEVVRDEKKDRDERKQIDP